MKVLDPPFGRLDKLITQIPPLSTLERGWGEETKAIEFTDFHEHVILLYGRDAP